MIRRKRILTVLKLLVLLSIIIGLPLLVYFMYPDLIKIVMDRELLSKTLEENMLAGALIYVGLQVMQIVISFIPGQVIQFAGGYVFSVPMAFLLTVGGCILGEFIAFFLAKFLGRDFVFMLAGKERSEKFIAAMNSKKAFNAIILIYLLPGLPKDIFTYVAGLSKLKPAPFVLISTAARLPALCGSLLVGGFVYSKNTVGVVVVLLIAAIVLIVAFVKRKSINALLDRVYQNQYTK
ncbi:MAG: VTT domain-containing protein [Clostridiales Family XIII bacterium]|jgi:uncharacterized membrane protein YdjX (TVP38/TMEM64 family)|nr:VTT domain-containing protein [Clostridiales Family XIII bacterium]